MLRIHLLQVWYDLSDAAMEDAPIELATMRRFAGIALITDRIPHEATILVFRHLLEQSDLGDQIFEALEANGMAMKQGTISSMRPSSRQQDPPRMRGGNGILRCTRAVRASIGTLV